KKDEVNASLVEFLPLLQQADRAYRADVSYAVAMSNAARAIESKREVWKLRLELREASKNAQKTCKDTKPFVCDNEAPCGLGSCRFAEGDMVLLNIKSPGNTSRPQFYSKEPYGLEGV